MREKMKKIIAVILVLVSITSVSYFLVNYFNNNQTPEVTPQPEPQPTPTKVKLEADLWYDSTVENSSTMYDSMTGIRYLKGKGFWIELHNQYSVEAYNLKLIIHEKEYIWNNAEDEWEAERIQKEVSLPFTLEPNETVSFFICDYYENFFNYKDPEVYAQVIF
jgi:hypothetical protein